MTAPPESNSPKRSRRQQEVERVFEALREIGVLLIAFSPLDTALGTRGGGEHVDTAVEFFVLGLVLFISGTFGERYFDDD